MAFFNIFGGETRSGHSFKLSDTASARVAFGGVPSFSGERVSEEAALGIPAIAAAISVQAKTIASLPIGVFKKTDDGRIKADKDSLQRIINERVNDDGLTKAAWLEWFVSRLLTSGRAFTWVEKNKAKRPMNLWPLNDRNMVVKLVNGRKVYEYTEDGVTTVYQADEMIDVVWKPTADPAGHVNPIVQNKNIIGEMIAAQRYASAMFDSGGIPAHLIKVPPGSPEAEERAFESVFNAMTKMREKKRPALGVRNDFDVQVIGLDPQKQQLLGLRVHHLGEVARIWNVPPSFVQDHSRSTYSNVEQLNLHYSQHTILPLVTKIEAELNVKLTSDRNRDTYVEFNMEGLERGDKRSQYEGFRVGIHGGFLKPNEVRAWLNLPAEEGGDVLYIQGATTKMTDAGVTDEAVTSEPDVVQEVDSEDKDVAE